VNEDGRFVTVTLASNPSHLESIDSVVEGLARGAQKHRNDGGRKRVIPVLIHGDAAFSGQGVVAETFNLSQTLGYKTGGTVHIIVNNQIGFTTSTRDARSTFFPTDIAKIIPVPIFHVNGDDPEAVIHVVNLALNFRQEFGRDAIIDIFCYRRHGHNEGDEPSFTHPRMYRIIREHRSVTTLYGEQLAEGGGLSSEDQAAFRESYVASLRDALKGKSGRAHAQGDGLTDAIRVQNEQNRFSFTPVDTGISLEKLKAIGEKTTQIPEGFHIHSKLKRIVETRRKNILEGGSLDFSTAESLAFGSLLLEKTAIRLSGEDSGRGTFSQRHAVWWDIEADQPTPYVPLNSLSEDQASFTVFDSPLSEYSILGFEYGYSLALPEELVLWEAQFGDFANGAQVLIDNYIASGEAKWNSKSRLVMLLPHGYEGMGPEHSSAHLERYLTLCAGDNLQVCNATTPSQYFHLLRRQMKQTTVKPLLLMTPKSLLRHPAAVSSLEELSTGYFQYVLDDPEVVQNPSDVERVILCSGKIYYDLAARRNELARPNTAIIRIEQLYPFPVESLREKLQSYGSVRSLVWAQEETRNRGAWNFVKDRMAEQLGIRDMRYCGRGPGPSPATGSHHRHQQEHEAILSSAFEQEPEAAVHVRGGKSASVSGKR
jgi:2-oxoglutarate dehydrogenase E1 component